ncbi:hypothetical protein B7P43_G13249 [Cryptotermes secundus]|uniref:protein-tyrosine-phosphatase n=1 Tax=Cryptotermes secundus TaxID=105785 RepID=A0A2J7R0R0_9NEOP|nr:hypothetical protein B7P43_G13249 [Cryptotermes secundus]
MDGKIEHLVCIRFCMKLGKSATETLEIFREAFGEHSLSRTVMRRIAPSSRQRARPHVSENQSVTNNNMAIVPHTPYSPDLAKCDFVLLPKLIEQEPGLFDKRHPDSARQDKIDLAWERISHETMRLRSLNGRAIAESRQQQRHLGSSCSSAATSSTDSSDSDDRCDSSLGLEEDRDFPVLILPHLFLGNAATSEDSEALSRHSIEYILNVTADLPNVFEDSGSIKYMKIPIADHWKENLASFFPKAIEFIDEARSNEKGVLVHCLAGVSRSVTVTVAYLMYKLSLSLNDAFNMVRARKSNIAPNFHFMQQLHNFECELTRSPKAAPNPTQAEARCCTDPDCKCPAHFLSPLAIGTSPDSGIEFDRWTSAPGE